MTVTHMLGEDELGDVQEVARGGVEGHQGRRAFNEFAIIATGVKEGWSVAREMWQGISKKTADALQHAGDSVEVAEKWTKGVAVDAKIKWRRRRLQQGRDRRSVKEDDAQRQGHARRRRQGRAHEAGVTLGLARHRRRRRQRRLDDTHQTRFGFAIEIDPKDDHDGSMIAALANCKQKWQYMMFLGTYPKARMISRTEGTSDAERTDIGASIGGHNVAGLYTHQGVDVDVKTDAQGRVLGKRVAGKAGAGGNLGPIADSVDEEAVAEVDEDGQASLTLTRTTKSKYDGRAREKLGRKLQARLTGKQDNKGKGAVVAGGDDEDDTTTFDQEGIALSNADLRRIGKIACGSGLISMRRRFQETGRPEQGYRRDPARQGQALGRRRGARPLHRRRPRRAPEDARAISSAAAITRRWASGSSFPTACATSAPTTSSSATTSCPTGWPRWRKQKGNAAAAEECKRLLAIADRIQGRGSRRATTSAVARHKREMLSELRQVPHHARPGHQGLRRHAQARGRSEDPRRRRRTADEAVQRLLRRAGCS